LTDEISQEPPSAERETPSAAELFERAREAVSALRGHGRRADGKAGIANTLAMRTGFRSTQLLEQPDIAAWHREEVEAITTDLGGDGELTTLARANVREAARLEVILATLGTELLEGGVLTGKGHMRAATTVYLQVLDRFTRLWQSLGLERRAKRVDLAQAFAEQERTR
jgi:hypothetical protein